MVGLVRLIGILLAIIGVVVLFRPEVLKQMISYVEKGKRTYWSCGIKTVIGIIFLLAALQCKVPLVIAVLGILFVSSLVICMMMGEKGIKAMIKFWKEKPPVILRLWSVLTLAIGLLIIISA
ncbi:MAG: hypothetical protein WBB86_02480 [Candidatus Omnitrophota bacterium]